MEKDEGQQEGQLLVFSLEMQTGWGLGLSVSFSMALSRQRFLPTWQKIHWAQQKEGGLFSMHGRFGYNIYQCRSPGLLWLIWLAWGIFPFFLHLLHTFPFQNLCSLCPRECVSTSRSGASSLSSLKKLFFRKALCVSRCRLRIHRMQSWWIWSMI